MNHFAEKQGTCTKLIGGGARGGEGASTPVLESPWPLLKGTVSVISSAL